MYKTSEQLASSFAQTRENWSEAVSAYVGGEVTVPQG
jgi:hypothetical protein